MFRFIVKKTGEEISLPTPDNKKTKIDLLFQQENKKKKLFLL